MSDQRLDDKLENIERLLVELRAFMSRVENPITGGFNGNGSGPVDGGAKDVERAIDVDVDVGNGGRREGHMDKRLLALLLLDGDMDLIDMLHLAGRIDSKTYLFLKLFREGERA